jgi:predicted Zn-dependent peptidase
VDNNSNEGIAENLAKYYLLYGDINLINTEIDLYHSISREEIREVAKKYLNPNQRLVLDYIPTLETVRIKPLRTTKNNYSIHPIIYNRNYASTRSHPTQTWTSTSCQY